MKNGKWFFLFKMKIDGEDCVGDPMKYEQKVETELFASTEDEASNQANYRIEEIKTMSQNDLRKYCNTITSDDTISFCDFQIIYKKNLENVKIPDLSM